MRFDIGIPRCVNTGALVALAQARSYVDSLSVSLVVPSPRSIDWGTGMNLYETQSLQEHGDAGCTHSTHADRAASYQPLYRTFKIRLSGSI